MKKIALLLILFCATIFSGCTKKYAIVGKSSNDNWGTVIGGGDYCNGETVTLTAIPKEGYYFFELAGWGSLESTNHNSQRGCCLHGKIRRHAVWGV